MSNQNYTRQFKIVLLGDAGCGKTAFVNRISKGDYSKTYSPTLGVEVTPIYLSTNQGDLIYSIWDTAGKAEFRGLKQDYYIHADLAIIFFDVNDKTSFDNITKWEKEFENVCPNSPIIFLGNKVDIKGRLVYPDAIEAKLAGQPYFDFSVRSNYNIEMPFLQAAKILLNNNNVFFIEKTPILPPVV